MPYRIAIGSCSHPSLPQPLWKIIHSRKPAAFIWGGDAVYADVFAGINWTAAGLHRIDPNNNATTDGSRQGGWRLTFPPPSIHIDATPGVIRDWYEKQWEVEDYRNFVEAGMRERQIKAKAVLPIKYVHLYLAPSMTMIMAKTMVMQHISTKGKM